VKKTLPSCTGVLPAICWGGGTPSSGPTGALARTSLTTDVNHVVVSELRYNPGGKYANLQMGGTLVPLITPQYSQVTCESVYAIDCILTIIVQMQSSLCVLHWIEITSITISLCNRLHNGIQ
jgi:hypothetical protein